MALFGRPAGDVLQFNVKSRSRSVDTPAPSLVDGHEGEGGVVWHVEVEVVVFTVSRVRRGA